MKNEMDESEVICSKCNGRGFCDINDHLARVCPKCDGEGKLDWIENITGVPQSYDLFNIPILRKSYPQLITSELVSIEPKEI